MRTPVMLDNAFKELQEVCSTKEFQDLRNSQVRPNSMNSQLRKETNT